MLILTPITILEVCILESPKKALEGYLLSFDIEIKFLLSGNRTTGRRPDLIVKSR